MHTLKKLSKRYRKQVKYLVPTILVIGFAWVWFATPVGVLVSYRLAPDFPKNDGKTLIVPRLKAPAYVHFDKFGIPHIEANDAEDLAAATGLIQGRDRGFQLDLLRHLAAGRLSELVGDRPILGSTTTDFDKAMRGWDFLGRTQVNLKTMAEFDRKILLAFTEGINQALNTYRSLEHRILKVTPRPWTVSDTILVGLLQSWAMIHNWGQEAVRFSLASQVGLDIASQLYPHSPSSKKFSIPATSEDPFFGLPTAVAEELKDLFPKAPVKLDKRRSKRVSQALTDLIELLPSASNAWVVSGKKSRSGLPILHNDMHLTHVLPSILYLQHIKTPQLDAIGVTMPGIPFLVSGFNGSIAWGVTSAAADIIDLVVEKPDPKNPGHVLDEEKLCPIIKERMTLRVRTGNSFENRDFILRKTCHGPVINDMYPDFFPENAPMLSIRWEVPKIQNLIGHLYEGNTAKTIQELRDALMKIPNPIQNVTAADIHGDFGFFSTGSVPVRNHHRGTFPIPGWSKKYNWAGWTRSEGMPHDFNNSQEFYINSNNAAVDPTRHRPIFQVDSAKSLRYQAVEDQILEKQKFDQEDLRQMQSINTVYRAKEILPFILSALEKNPEWSPIEKKSLEILQKWDFSSDKKSAAALIFFQHYRDSIFEVLDDKVSENVIYFFLKQRYSGNAADTWYHDENHIAWDDFQTKKRENRTHSLQLSFRKAIETLKEKYGADPEEWSWGQAHYHQPTHPFGGHWALSFLNLKRVPLAGFADTVWKAQSNMNDPKNPFKNAVGPVFRFSIDLGNPKKALFSIDTGQSGWPMSPHYGDLYEKWIQNELVPMNRDIEQLAELGKKIILLPH